MVPDRRELHQFFHPADTDGIGAEVRTDNGRNRKAGHFQAGFVFQLLRQLVVKVAVAAVEAVGADMFAVSLLFDDFDLGVQGVFGLSADIEP